MGTKSVPAHEHVVTRYLEVKQILHTHEFMKSKIQPNSLELMQDYFQITAGARVLKSLNEGTEKYIRDLY